MSTHDEGPLEGEEIVPDEEAQNPAASLKRLREKLSDAIKEKQQYLEQSQRAQADLVNFKRQEEAFQQDRITRLKGQFAESLIPTLDSFEMALQAPAFQSADPQWKKGIEAVQQGLLKSLEQLGIVRYVPAIDEPFNPHVQEALQEVPTTDPKKDHLVEGVHRAGYSIGDRVIRPAQVSIYTLRTE